MNGTLSRFVRAHFTMFIDEEADHFQDRSKQLIFPSQSAVCKSAKTIVVKIYPRMKGETFYNSDERSQFLDVQHNFRK